MTTVTHSTEFEQRIPKNGRWGKILLAIILSSFMTASIVLAVIFLFIPHVIKPAIAYREAMVLVHDGNYYKAITSFKKLGNFADSKKKIEFCMNAILKDKYNAAVGLYESGDYPKAITAFKELGNFRDSASRVVEIGKLPAVVHLNVERLDLLAGDSVLLGVEISPTSTEDTTLTWTSADESIAFVSSAGVIAAVNPGVTEITATTFNGKFAICTVEVHVITVVHVSTAKELMEAIAHYRKIILAPGTYDLSELSVIKNEFVHSEKEYIGYSYHIRGVNGLQIIGEEDEEISIVTKHLYADVLTFTECFETTLQNITFAQINPSKSYVYEGRVLTFIRSSSIIVDRCNLFGFGSVDQCNLFGFGSVGIYTNHANDLAVFDTRIYDCTLHAISVNNSLNVSFTRMSVYSNQSYSSLMKFNTSENIQFTNSILFNNQSSEHLVSLTRTDVVFDRCELRNNMMKSAIKREVRTSESKAYFYESIIKDNLGDTFLDDSDAVFTDCVIEDNKLEGVIISAYKSLVETGESLTSIDKNNTVYFQVKIFNSENNPMSLGYRIEDPDGNLSDNSWDSAWKSGDLIWINWRYSDPSIGSAGIVTLTIYKTDTGEILKTFHLNIAEDTE
jgi:hypothetical protein